MEEDITLDELGSEENNVDSVPSSETVETKDLSEGIKPNDVAGLSLEELNATLGKQFKDKETALKSLKDTFSYVGKKVDQVQKELTERDFISRKDLENLMFYRDNPKLEAHKDIIDAYATRFGITPKEAVNSEALSGLFAKVDKADSYEATQSVVESNPRFIASKDNLTKAREMVQKTGQMSDAAESLVAKAVLDAYEG